MAGQSDDTRKVAETAVGPALSDAAVSSYFTRQAATWVREHPALAEKLFLRKLALTFSAQHQWLDYSYPYYARDTGSLLRFLVVGPWLLVPLGFVDAGVPVSGARYALASALLQTGDRDGAIALLRTFSPAPDDTAESCYQVAMLAWNAGAPRVAERYARRALELRPGWPEPLDLLQHLR